jgi:hypothetical protein
MIFTCYFLENLMRNLTARLAVSMNIALWAIVLIFSASTTSAQWQKTYRAPNPFSGTPWLHGESVCKASDGGFITVGHVQFNFGWRIVMMKTDANGTLLWTRQLVGVGSSYTNGIPNERAYAVRPITLPGVPEHYIVVGTSNDMAAGLGNQNVIAIRTDFNGDIVWRHWYGTGGDDYGLNMEMVEGNNAFVVTGYMNGDTDNMYANTKTFILKADVFTGTASLTRMYQLGNGAQIKENVGFDIHPTSDNGYVVVGYTNRYNEDAGIVRVPFFLRTDGNGVIVASHDYINPLEPYKWGEARSIKQTSDGGFIVVGNHGGWNIENPDMFAMKTNNMGIPTWTRTYRREGCEDPNQWYETLTAKDVFIDQYSREGGYDIVGHGSRAFFMHIDLLGNHVTNKVYDATNAVTSLSPYAIAYGHLSMQPLSGNINSSSDGAYIIQSTGMWTYPNEIHLIKTLPFSFGNSNGCEHSICIRTTPVTPTTPFEMEFAGLFSQNRVPEPYERVDLELEELSPCLEYIYGRKGASTESSEEAPHTSSVYPNPVNQGEITYVSYIQNESGVVTVKVQDLLGNTVLESQAMYSAGEQKLPVDTKALNSGTYFIRITAHEQTTVQKLIIK